MMSLMFLPYCRRHIQHFLYHQEVTSKAAPNEEEAADVEILTGKDISTREDLAKSIQKLLRKLSQVLCVTLTCMNSGRLDIHGHVRQVIFLCTERPSYIIN